MCSKSEVNPLLPKKVIVVLSQVIYKRTLLARSSYPSVCQQTKRLRVPFKTRSNESSRPRASHENLLTTCKGMILDDGRIPVPLFMQRTHIIV